MGWEIKSFPNPPLYANLRAQLNGTAIDPVDPLDHDAPPVAPVATPPQRISNRFEISSKLIPRSALRQGNRR
jgi:hypothetical protein